MKLSFEGKTVLITGGTAGIGLATALAFAERGAQCWLTYRWGSADEASLAEQFAAVGAPAPRLVQADVGSEEDLAALMAEMKEATDRVHIFISNASGALRVQSLDDYTEKALLKSMHYSTWPTVSYPKAIHATFGSWPRYIVAMSSTGPDHYAHGYDFVASSKAVLETMCRYLTWHLREEDVRVNVVRSRAVKTDAFMATFGAELEEFAAGYVGPRHWVQPEEVAGTAVALCSGLLDAVKGQVINVDRGTTFADSVGRMYIER